MARRAKKIGILSLLTLPFHKTLAAYNCPKRSFLNTSTLFMMSSSASRKYSASTTTAAIMERYVSRTGLDQDGDPYKLRYLWTDSFAVGNCLQLARSTGNDDYRKMALHLVDAVHNSLGRFRSDDREGRADSWLSGSSNHPTAAGLRIGKSLNEKQPGDRFDRDTEWDKDGQYFHYLTKWMMVLDQMTRFTHDYKYNQWAMELMSVAADKFVYEDDVGRTRMYWKMSVDLSRPQVYSQGASDPLDGYITLSRLWSTRKEPMDLNSLVEKQNMFLSMVDISPSDDPLGLGGMLMDAYQLEKLQDEGAHIDARLIDRLLKASTNGLKKYSKRRQLQYPAEDRLAFRELGLSIGLHAVERMKHPSAKALKPFLPLATHIEDFWLDPEHQGSTTWKDHLDINEVMLATSLDPESWFFMA